MPNFEEQEGTLRFAIMQQIQARENTPTFGSQTITASEETVRTPREEPPIVLHLQVVPSPDERRVTWDEDVIDNENMGKKKSKVCCIYHRPRPFGESSSEESSSSSSDDSDYSNDDIPNRRDGDSYNLPNGGEPCAKHSKSKGTERRKRKPSPNAYERQPRYDKKKTEKGKAEASGP